MGIRVLQRGVLFPVLLYISTFIMTIFIVNLMIAKMTSSYEKIRGESISYFAHLQVGLIAEFKDDRDHPPPINFITYLPCRYESRTAHAAVHRPASPCCCCHSCAATLCC